MALKIPKTKTVDLGGGHTGTRISLAQEVNTQSLEDVRTLLRETTERDTRQQVAQGNPPQFWEVDGQTGKPVEQAMKRTVVVFGAALAAAAMRLIESALEAAIRKSATARSGALADVKGRWEWKLITRTGERHVSSANPPVSLSIADKLILMPAGVPYATNVNQAVDGVLRRASGTTAGEGSLKRRRRVKHAGAAAKGSSVGFLETATASLRARSEFKQFSIYAAFTRSHKVSGERSRMQGSPMIVVRPRLRITRMR